MPVLCVDVGNLHTTIGLLATGQVQEHWRLVTDSRRTRDEWGLLLDGLLALTRAEITGVAICATVPAVLTEFREVISARFATLPNLVVGPGIKTGLPLLVDNPRELGTDRICNAVAAAQLYPTGAIVVDFGTATTFDLINPSGEFIGGAILPGVELSLASLAESATQLRTVELAKPRNLIAKNTVEALQSGAIFGFASQIEGMITRLLAAAGSDLAVIATGQIPEPVLAECSSFTDSQPYLTLLGLEILLSRNS